MTQAKLLEDWDATSVGINFNFFRRQVVNVKVAQYMPSFQVSKAKKQFQSESLRISKLDLIELGSTNCDLIKLGSTN